MRIGETARRAGLGVGVGSVDSADVRANRNGYVSTVVEDLSAGCTTACNRLFSVQ